MYIKYTHTHTLNQYAHFYSSAVNRHALHSVGKYFCCNICLVAQTELNSAKERQQERRLAYVV